MGHLDHLKARILGCLTVLSLTPYIDAGLASCNNHVFDTVRPN